MDDSRIKRPPPPPRPSLPKAPAPRPAPKPQRVAALKRDEYSTGRGQALRAQALRRDALPVRATPRPSVPLPSPLSLPQVATNGRGFQIRGGSLVRPPETLDALDRRTSCPVQPPRDPPTPGEAAAETSARDIAPTVTTPPSQWTHADAARFTDAVASAAEAHRSDPAYVRSLMTMSADGLKRSAELIGSATEARFDRPSVEGLVTNVARLAQVAPEDAAARLAMGVAQQIDNDSELNYVDDGLDKALGGDSRFRTMLGGALDALGKGEAREELLDKHQGGLLGDLFDATVGKLVDGAKVFGGLVTEGAGAAWNFGGSVVGAVVDGGTRLVGP